MFTCLSIFINPLLRSEQSYSNLHRLQIQEIGLSKYQHHSTNGVQDHSQQHQLHVVKRQTVGTPEDEAYCSARISDAACSTGLNQGIIDAELICGMTTIEEATRDAKGCAINEHGKYCSSAWILFNVNNIELMNIEGNCSGVLASGACPTTCRTLLEDYRNRLGCCINTLINT